MEILNYLQEHWIASLALLFALFWLFGGRGSRISGGMSLSVGVKAPLDFAQGANPNSFGGTVQKTVTEINSSDPEFQPIMQALDSGNKIGAIKILRAARSLDLVTAKEIVELIERNRTKARSGTSLFR